jgi:hypothetical protein
MSDSGPKIRRDGWTAERQLRFLQMLYRTKNVGNAAAHAGMSRESSYRLRNRRDGALFAALWDLAFDPASEVHIPSLTDGRLARLLGNGFRRQARISAPPALSEPEAQRTEPL